MFGWLKKKAAQQSLFNVEINTRTLIVVSNRADAAITSTGAPDSWHIEKVASAQRSLLTDIQLSLANGASLEDVRKRIDLAKSKEPVTRGAEIAIEHVLSYAEQVE
jgi:hypothetical protein